ncbi:MAG: tetratricopeptide repeat protein [Deltaproteobacteria bacterium]|nr:tetratricopeptide repeat protein [Deltaproteobacteria bacterium]
MIVVASALAAPRSAAAETQLVVLGPVAATPRIDVAKVQKVLDGAEVAPRNARQIEPACAIDPRCLAAAGAELGALRVLAVSVGRTTSDGVVLDVLLVDVGGSDLLSRRELTIPERRLARELGPALKKFVAEAPVERAKVLFTRGNQHYNLGEFVHALEYYRRAYRAMPLSAFLFNIAQCHRKLGQHADAVTMYQSYLVGVPDAENKALVESLITESRASLAAEQRAAAAADKARHDTELSAAEKQKAEAMRRAKEAEAQAEAERTQAARIAADLDLYNKHPARKWAYIGAGIGAVAVVGGGVFGMRARDAQRAFDDAGCGDPTERLTQAELATCRGDRDRGERAAMYSNVLLIGGGAVIATSLLVFILDPGNLERPEQARAQLSFTPTSVQATVRW